MWNSGFGIIWKILICVGVLFECLSFVKGGCGGYIELTAGETRDISSTSTYTPYANCIWVVKAPDKYLVNIVLNFKGEKSSSGSCEDYIVLTDGSDSANELLNTCDDQTNTELNATARWMYIQFKADGADTTTGLTATLTTAYTGTDMSTLTDPIPKCKSHQFACSNKRCITLAYRCDGFDDCGCSVDCDEQQCGGISLEKSAYMGLGAGLGVAVFLGCFFGVYAYEKRRKLKALREEEEEQMASRRKGRAKDNNKGKDDKKDDKKVAWHS
ncbi:deleted in malignant brain tumors 1 protein-like [Ostrea edulis]|uniref:deleted in malignant brain tumors 1 protein-like n=1 Tax=Ostrea edulis TaxID=37623 RepID=UPI0024AF987F|nr:deleted in malignant brain tumors 1 protein-like [Ostrea edulis]XP_056016728.1 deleted in malignant brain tumors 1 protein-like [Ostrea edulis]